jgi:peptide/nickel transport system substrate-binding protein
MNRKRIEERKMRTLKWLSILAIATLLVAACGPTPAPQVVKEVVTEVVEKQVVVTEVVEKQVEVEVVVTATPVPEAAPPTEPVAGGTLNISLGEDFVTFDPYFDEQNDFFKAPMFEAPIRANGNTSSFEPWLAESYEVSPDGTYVTLKMRQGVKFHNGREMTADDVVWSVERALDAEKGYHLNDRFQTCTGATKVDDYTVQVNYSVNATASLDGLARLYIFPKEAEENIATVPVGTGPFKFEEWVPGDHLTLTKFEDYWQEGRPYIDEIVVKPIPDVQARQVNLLAGAVDGIWGIQPADVALLETVPGITVGRPPGGGGFIAFIMNVLKPPFENQKVRQALQYATDRDKINQLAFSGEGEMINIPRSKASWAYSEEADQMYTYDPEKAKQLLAEAGFPDGFKTSMLIRGTQGIFLDVAQVWQADLANVGVDLELLPTDLPQFWPAFIGSQFETAIQATGDSTIDPSGLFEGAACCRPFRNFSGITEDTTWFPEYKAIIEQAKVELDQDKRKELYDQALKIMMDQAWTVPIAWDQTLYALTDKVQGFTDVDSDGQMYLQDVWLTP